MEGKEGSEVREGWDKQTTPKVEVYGVNGVSLSYLLRKILYTGAQKSNQAKLNRIKIPVF